MTTRHLLTHGALLALLTPALVSARIPGLPFDDEAAQAARAVASPAETFSVPFSDPGRPGLVRVGLTNGSITVRAHSGKDVIVGVRGDERSAPDRVGGPGLRRISSASGGVDVEEERNEMRISSTNPNRVIALDLQVPTQTSLVLNATNNGDIVVEGVSGDIEVDNTNGAVTLRSVSGAVVAHALNQDVVASLVGVSGKPMSFSSLNGDIDVTLPASIKATVRMQAGQGDVYSDFDLAMQPTVTRQEGGQRTSGGKYILKVEQTMIGTINGGGPEITLKTFNGTIRLKKGA